MCITGATQMVSAFAICTNCCFHLQFCHGNPKPSLCDQPRRLTVAIGYFILGPSYSPLPSIAVRRSTHMRQLSIPPTCVPRRHLISLRTLPVVASLMAHRRRLSILQHLTTQRARTVTLESDGLKTNRGRV